MNRRHLRLTAEAPKPSPLETMMPNFNSGPLLSTKDKQAPSVAYPVLQELVKPQLPPTPQDDEVTHPMGLEVIKGQAAPSPQADVWSTARCSSRRRVLQKPAYHNDYAC